MSTSPLSFSQMAAHAAEHGGGSFDWYSGKPVEGPGFMAAYQKGETEVPEVTAEAIGKFRAEHDSEVKPGQKPHLGIWGNTLDVSRKIISKSRARKFGKREKQEAIFALPGTGVMPGVKAEEAANPWGANVLLHSQLKGTDADPAYNRTGNFFTKNEVENPDWEKTQGELGGKPVSYGDLMRNLNKARTDNLRGK